MRTGRMKSINARNVIEVLSCSARSVQVGGARALWLEEITA
jgi:hypothetical protein